MSNLGLYQNIVEQAKALGGVENLVADVGKAAVARAAPGLLRQGFGLGLGAAVVLAGVGYGAKLVWDARAERLAAGALAERRLRAIVDAAAEADGSAVEEDL